MENFNPRNIYSIQILKVDNSNPVRHTFCSASHGSHLHRNIKCENALCQSDSSRKRAYVLRLSIRRFGELEHSNCRNSWNRREKEITHIISYIHELTFLLTTSHHFGLHMIMHGSLLRHNVSLLAHVSKTSTLLLSILTDTCQ